MLLMREEGAVAWISRKKELSGAGILAACWEKETENYLSFEPAEGMQARLRNAGRSEEFICNTRQEKKGFPRRFAPRNEM